MGKAKNQVANTRKYRCKVKHYTNRAVGVGSFYIQRYKMKVKLIHVSGECVCKLCFRKAREEKIMLRYDSKFGVYTSGYRQWFHVIWSGIRLSDHRRIFKFKTCSEKITFSNSNGYIQPVW